MKYALSVLLGKLLDFLVLFWIIALVCGILDLSGPAIIVLDIAISIVLIFILGWAQKCLFGNSLGGWFFSTGVSNLGDCKKTKEAVTVKRVVGVLIIVILAVLIFC